MKGRIIALAFIFVCTSFAWFFLGTVTLSRSSDQDGILKEAVSNLWGKPQHQKAPTLTAKRDEEYQVKEEVDGVEKTITRKMQVSCPFGIDSSDILVKLDLEHRKKGLLWYSTYIVDFDGSYKLKNDSDYTVTASFLYPFPLKNGIYEDFTFSIDGKEVKDINPEDSYLTEQLTIAPSEEKTVRIAYRSHGMNNWWYEFGSGVSKIKNFNLTMLTNFDKINFPDNSISPTEKVKTDDGWSLKWNYGSLISGIQIGMEMPQKLNPGPWVGRLTFFAPVSLFLFLFLLLIITTIRGINIHPMNYFFIASSFFAFHLLLAYLIDHINIHLAFAISSVVSIGLVISYMRLVAGIKFALVETGISQFVYLILFSYAFFLEGYTGLSITIVCILTLFAVMMFTGKTDWDKIFAAPPASRQTSVANQT